jgi:hypothetical protein
MDNLLSFLENEQTITSDGELYCFNIDNMNFNTYKFICKNLNIEISDKYQNCYNDGKIIGQIYSTRCGFGRFSSYDKKDVVAFIIGFLSTLKFNKKFRMIMV